MLVLIFEDSEEKIMEIVIKVLAEKEKLEIVLPRQCDVLEYKDIVISCRSSEVFRLHHSCSNKAR
ncbi:hypothetical protein RBU61_06750 [Tissierella sp. MB52-C2]|uniref:hypothetical protein n=1 Tax=Tissierella sp. MB52-C2 TaxID=3070999 RepID=UPI00280ADF96|nr:hypothetical protein [Tissierella sp. MB52-C2]WMM26366.1 hypothetical protein RBU61_06750 [Tissierella sp. MB52-C2]